MANEEHLKIIRQGVETWNRWREENPTVLPDLSGAELSGAILLGTDLRRVDLGVANLREAQLSGASLISANLSGADLRWAWLAEADLGGANLNGANLDGAILGRATLSRADLRWANLNSVDLLGADLRGADLRQADLGGADLRQADLSQADRRRADLSGANLRWANLTRADLSGTNLRWADLSQAEHGEIGLSEAQVGGTNFAGVDLRRVRGLETVIHDGPSSIGIDTVYLSEGNIPEVLLPGVGVPDTFIEYMASLVGKPFEFYSYFISHSSKDQSFAQRLHNDLQGEGVRCWFAPEDMRIGDRIRPSIDQAIRVYDKLLIVLSEHSIDSDWVEKEVETAFEEERKRRKTMLFPIRLDSAVMETNQAWAADIRRTRHIGDFTRWEDHAAYQKAFDRLLRDLKAEEGGEGDS